MSTILTNTARPASVTLQYFFWQHPEWWSAALSAFAWTAVLLHARQHAGHGSFAQEFAYWVLMVAAMMLPNVMYPVRVTAASSLWARRHRAIAGFLAGYFAPWVVLGIVAAALREGTWTHTYAAPAFGFAGAAVWQKTPMHRRALIACHVRLPLAPTGWTADRDCLRFGCTIGAACVWSCWPLMLACAFAGHSLIAMMGGTIVGAVERRWFRPPTPAVLVGTLAIASYYLVLAAWDPGLV
jgi:predicted metal-binding membrane protein